MRQNSIYARANESGIVEKFFSDVFEMPIETDLLIESGNEDYHAHAHLKYQAYDENGLHNYKMENGMLTKRSEEEKVAEMAARPEPPKSELEILRETVDMLVLESLGG